jgi:putative inorganic carbon (HCO3(-)) transporter
VLVVGFVGIDVNPLAFSDFIAARLPGVRLGLQGIAHRGVNPNALAAAALLIVPLGVSVLLVGPYQMVDLLLLQVPGFMVVACGMIILVISQSRSAWIAIWVTLTALLVRGPVSWVWRVLLGTAVVAGPMLAAGRMPFVDRAEFLAQAAVFWDALADRAHIMSAGLDLLRGSPWLGIGLNQFRHVYHPPPSVPPYDVVHSHNVYLQTALDIGLLGLVSYCALLVFLLIRADRAARGPSPLGRSAAAGACTAILAIHAFGLTDAVALGAKVGLFQWMAGGLILSAWRIQFPDSSGRSGHAALVP